METVIANARKNEITQLLMVSGAKKSESVDSVNIFEKLDLHGIDAYCVYNPYYQGQRAQIELERLKSKLNNPHIKGVFLQIGTDVYKLKKSITEIKQINKDLVIASSILFPTQPFLDRIQLKPWSDVFFDHIYLKSLTHARQQTAQVYIYCNQNNISMLVQLLPLQNDSLNDFLNWKKSSYSFSLELIKVNSPNH